MKPTTILTLAFVAPSFAYPITATDSTVSGNQHHLVERNFLDSLGKVAKVGVKLFLARDLGERALVDKGHEISARRSLPRRSVDNDFDRRDLDQLDARNLDNKLEARGIDDDGLEARYFEDDLEAREFDDDFLDARDLDYETLDKLD